MYVHQLSLNDDTVCKTNIYGVIQCTYTLTQGETLASCMEEVEENVVE